jgi:GntR family transcriptional regulator, transcriptional repressor for pyruvate dehydrogenase complex
MPRSQKRPDHPVQHLGTTVTRRPSQAIFRPIETRKAFQSVVEQIADLIHTGLLQEGDLLPGERTLADQMAVSRPTIRLALATLADAGVVQVSPGRAGGAQILTTLIPEHLSGIAAHALDADAVFETLEARRAVEPRVAQLAALRGNAADFAELEHTIKRQRAAAAASDWKGAAQADMQFHRRMWRASGNPALERMMVGLFSRLTMALDMVMRTPEDTARAIALQESALTALRTGQPAHVEAAMDEHLAYLEEIAEEVLGRVPLREPPSFLRSKARERARP